MFQDSLKVELRLSFVKAERVARGELEAGAPEPARVPAEGQPVGLESGAMKTGAISRTNITSATIVTAPHSVQVRGRRRTTP